MSGLYLTVIFMLQLYFCVSMYNCRVPDNSDIYDFEDDMLLSRRDLFEYPVHSWPSRKASPSTLYFASRKRHFPYHPVARFRKIDGTGGDYGIPVELILSRMFGGESRRRKLNAGEVLALLNLFAAENSYEHLSNDEIMKKYRNGVRFGIAR